VSWRLGFYACGVFGGAVLVLVVNFIVSLALLLITIGRAGS